MFTLHRSNIPGIMQIHSNTETLSPRFVFGKLQQLSLSTQFMMATSLVVIALMSVLTFWTANRVERAALAGAGAVGALYLQTFVSPLIDEADIENMKINPVLESRLKQLLGTGPLGQHVKEIKIWKPDGGLLYSTSGSTIESPVIFDELRAALSGEIVVSQTEEEKHQYSADERAELLIEVYAPLWTDRNGQIGLVGEFYAEPQYLVTQLESVQQQTLLVVGAITLPMLGLLYLIVRTGSKLIARQRLAIEENLEQALALSSQNRRLRLDADFARIEATKLNEKILDQIGGDLHDGPLQVLTLSMLRLTDLQAQSGLFSPEERCELANITDILSNAVSDLRTTAAGLALPELDGMKLEDAIRLSVQRYCDLTGHAVELHGSIDRNLLSTELNVCAYRFTQEALMNAFRHASGNLQKVKYHLRNNRLVLLVADMGRQTSPTNPRKSERIKLGRVIQKRRVRAAGGRMRSFSRPNGTVVAAVLPIDPPTGLE